MSFALSVGTIVTGSIMLGGMVGSAIIKGVNNKKDRKLAANLRMRAEMKTKVLEKSRQKIINPYANVEDLSGNFSNPFTNLSVATGAAEIQMEQSDSALANTLDTLRATGAGAGGATALAQAALQSKKGVAASIESQEVANQKLAAKGEETLQRSIVNEQERLQNAEIKGAGFVYNQKEQREREALDRVQSQFDQGDKDFRAATQAGRQNTVDTIEGITEVGANMAGTVIDADQD